MSTGTVPRRRPPLWSVAALRQLTESPACPVCDAVAVHDERCGACGADFTTIGEELWRASLAAAAALDARQEVLDRVPLPVGPRPALAPARAPSPDRDLPPLPRPGSNATVQSVLALAGAGLVAVAAIVFTFFNPDLTDRGVRGLIVAAITLVFLFGARVLVRRRLQFSAEAVGALGMVFVGLDVSSISELAAPPLSPWVLAALGTLVAGGVMVVLGAIVRVRVWLWTSLIGLALVPVMFGLAAGRGVGILAGALATAGAAFALIRVAARLAGRFDGGLKAERIALTVVELLFVGLALLPVWTSPGSPTTFWFTTSGTLFAIAALGMVSAKHPAGALWSFIAGGATVGAVAVLPLAGVPGAMSGQWAWVAAVPAAAVVGLVTAGALVPTPAAVRRRAFHVGALLALATSTVPVIFWTGLLGAATVLGADAGDDLLDPVMVGAVATGLAALALGLGAFGVLASRRGSDRRWVARVGEWFAVLAALVTMTSVAFPLGGRITLGLVYAVVASLTLALIPRLRALSVATRAPVVVGAHAALLLAAILSWRDDDVVVWAGAALVGALIALARTVPAAARFWHVGAGYAYALVIFATALGQLGLGSIALLCLTTTVGGLGAIVATFVPAVRPRAWWAVLAVTFVPFVIGVVQVVFERSGWTALSTAVIFALALALVNTRRPGLGAPLRALAAAILVPTLAVVAVCLGAQFLEISGSPVVLPVIATVVAVVLPSLPSIRHALTRRVGAVGAIAASRAVEASTLLTATITVGLSLARESAGLGTTLIVLTVLGAGAGAGAHWGRRRYGWWLAAAAFTGALWCTWALAGVAVFEPYVLPPALAAALVGLVLTARGAKGQAIYAAGITLAVAPVGILLAIAGSGGFVPWRGYALVAAAWALLAAGTLLGRGDSATARRLRRLRAPSFGVAIAAGAAGAVQAVRWGLALDAVPVGGAPTILFCLALGIAGALPAVLAARGIQRATAAGSPLASTRWLFAPAMGYVAVAAWPAIQRDWFTIWTMWALLLVFLATMLATAVRSRSRATALPPVWFVFAISFVTAVVAWSPRDLRVEWFSLPLGFFLLAAGASAMWGSGSGSGSGSVDEADADAPRPGRLSDWPRGWRGSWALVAPGLVVLLSASIAATYTDPLTWRAILVLVLALAAILIGAGTRRAAPFLIGIIVLPVENVLAFVVQIGRGIESMPWWITLSVVGAVLLIIAVTYERREGEGSGIAARIRDLG